MADEGRARAYLCLRASACVYVCVVLVRVRACVRACVYMWAGKWWVCIAGMSSD